MILLDTHVCLWLADAPGRIGPATRTLIEDHPQVCFSAVVTIEATIKRMVGRLPLPRNVHRYLTALGLDDLPLTSSHAAAMEEFPELLRHDPFDRLLLAQAYVERARFVTANRRLLALGLDWVLDATE